MIQMKCPNCGHHLQIPDEYAGTTGRCRHCGTTLVVPKTGPGTFPSPPIPQGQTDNPALAPDAVQPRFAGFWRRLLSNLIDFMILLLPVWLLSPLLTPSLQILNELITADTPPEYRIFIEQGMSFLVHLSIFLNLAFTYFLVFEASPLRATPGKLALRISVQGMDGAKIGFVRTVLRNLLKPLSLVIFGVGVLMIAFTKKKQALHDKLTATVVARFEPQAVPGIVYSGLAIALVAITLVIALPSSGRSLSQNIEIAGVKAMRLSEIQQYIDPKVRSKVEESMLFSAIDFDPSGQKSAATGGMVLAAVAEAREIFLNTSLEDALRVVAKDEVQWHLGELPASSNYYGTHELVYATFKSPDSVPVKLRFLSERDGEYIVPFTSLVGDKEVETEELLVEIWKQAARTIWVSTSRAILDAGAYNADGLQVGRIYEITGYLYAGRTPQVYSNIVRLQTSDEAEDNYEKLQALVVSGDAIHLTPGSVVELTDYLPDQEYEDLCTVGTPDSEIHYYLNRSWLSQSIAK